MGTWHREETIRCDNDCKMEGCPEHKLDLYLNTVSDYLRIEKDGKQIYAGDMNQTKAIVKLIKDLDYSLLDED